LNLYLEDFANGSGASGASLFLFTERSQLTFPGHALVLFNSVSNAVFELTLSLSQLCRHDVGSARGVHSARRIVLDLLTQMELMHQS
jgi:hypothetical protein